MDYQKKLEHISATGSTEVEAFATTAEAAQFLRLSKAMIHKMIEQKLIPARRYGRAVRIPRSWLRAQANI